VRRIDVDPRAAHGEAAQKERVSPAVVDAVDGLPDVRRVEERLLGAAAVRKASAFVAEISSTAVPDRSKR
jgi:hypothetical protein